MSTLLWLPGSSHSTKWPHSVLTVGKAMSATSCLCETKTCHSVDYASATRLCRGKPPVCVNINCPTDIEGGVLPIRTVVRVLCLFRVRLSTDDHLVVANTGVTTYCKLVELPRLPIPVLTSL